MVKEKQIYKLTEEINTGKNDPIHLIHSNASYKAFKKLRKGKLLNDF